MKTLQFVLLGALLSFGACWRIPPRRCPGPIQGQVYSSCAPPAPDCVPTCENPQAACRAPCRPGCKCPFGEVVDTKSKRCVSVDLCPKDECSLEPDAGHCDGYFPRFFHNSTSSQCEEFIYGGCGGNGNNFETLSECHQKCGACPVEGQVFSTCARPCTFTCDNMEKLGCPTVCTTGCDCPGGQVIDTELNKCVPVEKCPTDKCPVKGQQFFDGVRECAPCVGTCEKPHPICQLACRRGCACPLGTVLDTAGNACVSPKQCPAGRACRLSDGTAIEDGDSYQPDPCTTCRCDNGKLICVVQDCAAPSCDDYIVPVGECCPVCPEHTECEYNRQTYQPGDSFPSSDGCNTCICFEGGVIGCTEKACIPKLVCPKPIGFGICVDLCVPGSACGPGQKCCSNGCGHVCTNATNCALVDCAPTQCDFLGGVVIPAGEDECCPSCGCVVGGTTYRVGKSFPAGDGCIICSCTPSGVRCTLIACQLPEA